MVWKVPSAEPVTWIYPKPCKHVHAVDKLGNPAAKFCKEQHRCARVLLINLWTLLIISADKSLDCSRACAAFTSQKKEGVLRP